MRRHDTYPRFPFFVVGAPCPHGGWRSSSSRDPTREPAGGGIFRGRGPRLFHRQSYSFERERRFDRAIDALLPSLVRLDAAPLTCSKACFKKSTSNCLRPSSRSNSAIRCSVASAGGVRALRLASWRSPHPPFKPCSAFSLKSVSPLVEKLPSNSQLRR
jgi:hypothetical protein